MNILWKIDMLRRAVGSKNLLQALRATSKKNIDATTSLEKHAHAMYLRMLTDMPLPQERGAVTSDEVENIDPQSKAKETIGFIGLGNIGCNMGLNLLKKGYNLVVYDINEKAMEPFKSSGATTATSPKQVAQQVNKIITMLPSSADVKEVYDGSSGIFRGVQQGTLLIDTSTIDPSVSKEISKSAALYNSSYMDAPASKVIEALTFTCGGSIDDFKVAEELLTNVATNVIYCGDVGCGQSAKICNNMLLAISMIGTSEVMNVGVRLGLDKKMLAHLLNISTGRCWSSEIYNPCPGVVSGIPSSNSYQGGYATQYMAKDLGLAQNAATATNSPIPLGSQAHQLYQVMCNSGYGKSDFSSVYKYLRKDV